jgi:hypothetical protein
MLVPTCRGHGNGPFEACLQPCGCALHVFSCHQISVVHRLVDEGSVDKVLCVIVSCTQERNLDVECKRVGYGRALEIGSKLHRRWRIWIKLIHRLVMYILICFGEAVYALVMPAKLSGKKAPPLIELRDVLPCYSWK